MGRDLQRSGASTTRPGARVVVLDDLGHWHGAFELIRTATDWPLRRKLKELGVITLHDAAITAWHGDGADILDLQDGTSQRLEADALVLATVNQSQTWLQDGLADRGLELHAVGDCVAPRLAVMAIYEGRELALRL